MSNLPSRSVVMVAFKVLPAPLALLGLAVAWKMNKNANKN